MIKHIPKHSGIRPGRAGCWPDWLDFFPNGPTWLQEAPGLLFRGLGRIVGEGGSVYRLGLHGGAMALFFPLSATKFLVLVALVAGVGLSCGGLVVHNNQGAIWMLASTMAMSWRSFLVEKTLRRIEFNSWGL